MNKIITISNLIFIFYVTIFFGFFFPITSLGYGCDALRCILNLRLLETTTNTRHLIIGLKHQPAEVSIRLWILFQCFCFGDQLSCAGCNVSNQRRTLQTLLKRKKEAYMLASRKV
eukprot:TRINITY_DN1892_c0_g1_i4.p2 TRINITY_DN1892_c0_g1~~TRINITY_DN1892_c0_g1_i4.p2  ORF type:complete len:115 (+),score=1.25 TRINITY_DN1892_c0_g1_i4:234-578(+)